MDSYYRVLNSLGVPFFSKRKQQRLNKYAILLNEPNDKISAESAKEPCVLATQLLPGITMRDQVVNEDLVQVLGEILEAKINAHAPMEDVAFMKSEKVLKNNSPTIVPVMYRIMTEEFAQNDPSTFKIIECRNATKLVSDWKPTLPDKLISLGHQVVIVQLETSFVPYTDFAYAILRQLDFDWKNRLPRSFFYPDDVCKVEETIDKDLCVISPSMPDGDLDISKKVGLLNYEVLMMIKTSCLGAMNNYLIKRDLRVGKFSDTLDGVSSLRYLYRKLQDRLRGELRFHAPETDEPEESEEEPEKQSGNEKDEDVETPRENRPTSSVDGNYSDYYSDGEDFKLNEFVEFRASLEKLTNATSKEALSEADDDEKEFPVQEFSADAIIRILQLPYNAQEKELSDSSDSPRNSE